MCRINSPKQNALGCFIFFSKQKEQALHLLFDMYPQYWIPSIGGIAI